MGTIIASILLGFGLLECSLAVTTMTSSDDYPQPTVVFANRPSALAWHPAGDPGQVQIDLYYCGDCCQEEDCGEWVATLCDGNGIDCVFAADVYDVTLPEPWRGVPGGYKVRVFDPQSPSTSNWSPSFLLLSSKEAPKVVRADYPSLLIDLPPGDGIVTAGDVMTVQLNYDNGMGMKEGRFKIDLYKSKGSEDCGAWAYSICDEPSEDCRYFGDSYDVRLPLDMERGLYSIRLGLFGDDTLFDCSPVFKVLELELWDIEDDWEGSSSSRTWREYPDATLPVDSGAIYSQRKDVLASNTVPADIRISR